MSSTETEPVRTREVLVRTFHVETQALDGRTLTVRAVPFGEIADVADPPDWQPYKEEFLPGVFSDQQNAVNRITLRTDHNAIDSNGERKPGVAGVVGQGVNMREDHSGVLIDFRFLGTSEADTALELVRGGGYDGVSAEFVSKKINKAGQIVQRVKAHLASVALAIGPAYSKAEILALRNAPEIVVDESLMPPAPNAALLERCADLGIELPEGMAILLSRAYTEMPWDGSASRWPTAEAYCAASAIDMNGNGPKTKSMCHLPYKEPSGEINIHGVRAALARIGQGDPVDATQAQRDEARVKLEKILASFNSTSPSA